MAASTDRFDRQSDIVKHDKFSADPSLLLTIIGVGAIGRFVAWYAAGMGIPRIRLVDFDKVDHHNRTTQLYMLKDVGKPKVICTADMMNALDPELKIEVVDDRFRPGHASDIMICCVDNMESRKTIWERSGINAKCYIDTRMRGETMRILAVDPTNEEQRKYYATTLFDDPEREPGRCTEPAVVFSAGVAAGYACEQLSRWLRDIEMQPDWLHDMLSGNAVDPRLAPTGFAA